MNAIINALYARKSVRVFTDQPVTQEIKEQILSAALQAASFYIRSWTLQISKRRNGLQIFAIISLLLPKHL